MQNEEFPMLEAPLTVELVPKTCWFSNVRDHVDKKTWDLLRHETYEQAGNRCEVCGGRGRRCPIECHEIWHYEDTNHVQTLLGLTALCPACHEVKHIGLAEIKGRAEIAKTHLAKVNGWPRDDVEIYLEAVWETWYQRSRYQWRLDFEWLKTRGVTITPKR